MSAINVVLTIPRPGTVELVERPYPKIIPGYAIVKVAIAPICIEARIWTTHQFEWFDDPEHLGHEGVGAVYEVAAGSRFRGGERVIVFQFDYCGTCYACRNGLSPTYCIRNAPPNGEALRGMERRNGSESGGFGMVQYRIAPEENLRVIDDDLDFRYAAAANCAVGCTYTNQEVMALKPGEWVLIGGIGFLGLGHIVNARYRNAKAIALVRNEYRAGLCRRMGVEHIIDPDDTHWLEHVRELTGGLGVDAAIECSGAPYYQRKCIEAARIYGRVNFTGHMPETRLDLHVLHDVLDKALSFSGSHDVRRIDREGLVRMLGDREVQRMIDVMITHEYPMSQAPRALEVSASKRCGKIYLYPWEDAPHGTTTR